MVRRPVVVLDRWLAQTAASRMHLVIGSAAMPFMLLADLRAVRWPGAGIAEHAAGAPGLAGIASAVSIAARRLLLLHVLR